MVVKIAKILSIGVMLVVLADARPAACEGWSLLHPFSSETKTDAKPKKPVLKTAQTEPSLLEKIGTGTKNFFNKTGETLGLKKPESKKPQYATPTPRTIQPRKKEESKSWFGSFIRGRGAETEDGRRVAEE